MKKQIPNILTIIRFILIPFIIYFLFKDDYVTTFIILTLSSLTDILDGFIARKFDLVTNVGKLLDPLADKATQILTIFAIFLKGIIPVWIIGLLVLKEIIMIAGASFLYGKELVVSSKWYGKLATVLLYLAIVSSLCIKQFKIPFEFDIYIYYFALIMTFFSLAMYIKSFWVKGYIKKEDFEK